MTQDIYGLEKIAERAVDLLGYEGKRLPEGALGLPLIPVLAERLRNLSHPLDRIDGAALSAFYIGDYIKILKEVAELSKEGIDKYAPCDSAKISHQEKVSNPTSMAYLDDRLRELVKAGLLEEINFKKRITIMTETWPLGESISRLPEEKEPIHRNTLHSQSYQQCFKITGEGEKLVEEYNGIVLKDKKPKTSIREIDLRGGFFKLTKLEKILFNFKRTDCIDYPEGYAIEIGAVRERVLQSIALLGIVADRTLPDDRALKTQSGELTSYSLLEIQDPKEQEKTAKVLNMFFERGFVLLDMPALCSIDLNDPERRKKVEEILYNDSYKYNKCYRINPQGRRILELAAHAEIGV